MDSRFYTKSKVERVAKLESLLRGRMIYFPSPESLEKRGYVTKKGVPWCQEAIKEMNLFSSEKRSSKTRHDDFVDALAMASILLTSGYLDLGLKKVYPKEEKLKNVDKMTIRAWEALGYTP